MHDISIDKRYSFVGLPVSRAVFCSRFGAVFGPFWGLLKTYPVQNTRKTDELSGISYHVIYRFIQIFLENDLTDLKNNFQKSVSFKVSLNSFVFSSTV